MSKSKGGRPPYFPTEKDREQTRLLAAMGLAHGEIALVIGVSAPTLRRHFRKELDTGKLEANAKVAAALYRAATDRAKPSVVAQIFWLKTQAGWVEPRAPREPVGDPPEAKTETLGKKVQSNLAARTAQVGTDWEALLPSSGKVQ